MNRAILLALFLISLALIPVAKAQDEGDFTVGPNVTFSKDYESVPAVEQGITGGNQPTTTGTEFTVVEDKHVGQYVEPTLDNISKLYWNKNALDLNNNTAIDNFMLINECEIYRRFFKDDFEWARVRDAGREMLGKSKDAFSDKFKIVLPIDLGRYDNERKGFPLINETAFKDLRRIEIGGNSNFSPVCGKTFSIEHYPRNLILILNKPFSYDFVSLDEHIAQAFIVRRKYEDVDRPRELLNDKYDRLAFARIRITFSDYQGETKGVDNYPIGVMFGSLDGIDIFEDPDEKRMLTSLDYKQPVRKRKTDQINNHPE